MEIVSPCMGICQLDAEDICVGCLRQRDEITAWKAMDNDAKRALLEQLKVRRIAKGRIGSRGHKRRRRA